MTEYESACSDLLDKIASYVPGDSAPLGVEVWAEFDGTIVAELDVTLVGFAPRARFVGTATNPAWELM